MRNDLEIGDPIPWLTQICAHDHRPLSLESAGGRFVLFCFPDIRAQNEPLGLIKEISTLYPVIDNLNIIMFLVVSTPDAGLYDTLHAQNPGIRVLLDHDGRLRNAFACSAPVDIAVWYVSNPRQQIIFRQAFPSVRASLPVIADMAGYLPKVRDYAPDAPAPLLSIETVFEPALCNRLIHDHQHGRRVNSPIMTEKEGRTGYVHDHAFKNRMDSEIPSALNNIVQKRISDRVYPEIEKAFQFRVSAIDRIVLGCYDARQKGRFGMHRDNTLAKTRHRKFACSINLNENYEGGFIGFPEYGSRFYKPSRGSAIVFSCSLLHLVTPVLVGQRYAALLFLM